MITVMAQIGIIQQPQLNRDTIQFELPFRAPLAKPLKFLYQKVGWITIINRQISIYFSLKFNISLGQNLVVD